MSRPRIRPEFTRPLPVAPRELFTALADALAHDPGPCRGRVFDDWAILRIRGDERRVWSPALQLHFEADAAGGLRLRGRFTPSSPVWTAFVAIYLALGCIAVASGCWGYAQWTVDATPWALLGVPAALALAGFTYGAAFIGQGLGAEDMYELRSFVDRVLDRLAESAPRVSSAV